MKNLSLYRVLCVAITALFIGTLTLEANARGRGGGGRGGGVRISRSGPASGGSFSSRASQARSTRATQSRPQVTSRGAGTRRNAQIERQSERQSNLAKVTEGSQDQHGDRKTEREERRNDRYERRDNAREDWQDYHDDHYHYYYDDDWDDWMGYAAAGTVVVAGTAAVGSTISESNYEELECTPEKVEVEGITYVKCGDNWYMPTYKSGEVAYVIVDPPSGQ